MIDDVSVFALGVVTALFLAGTPALTGPAEARGDEFFNPADAEIVDTIKEVIETRARPARGRRRRRYRLQGVSRRDGLSRHEGSESSTAALKHGIENLFKHFLPEVKAVEQI